MPQWPKSWSRVSLIIQRNSDSHSELRVPGTLALSWQGRIPVVSNLALSNCDRFLDELEGRPRILRTGVSLLAALVLYGGKQAFKNFFHWVGIPRLEALVIVIGVVLAGLIRPGFLGTLCHAERLTHGEPHGFCNLVPPPMQNS
jgi:hypothetical protein